MTGARPFPGRTGRSTIRELLVEVEPHVLPPRVEVARDLAAVVKALALLLVLAACAQKREEVPLARELTTVASGDPKARELVIKGWKLSRAAWQRTIVAPFEGLYDDYVRAFDAAVPALVEDLGRGGAITTRRHFAGDPLLTRGQVRARWVVPTQFPSEVAMRGDDAIDAVFVREGSRWRALVGIDAIVIEKTAALDATCAKELEHVGAKICQELAWAIADAAVRSDRRMLERSCALSRAQCVK